jgi:stress-induced morphogen
MAMAASEIEGLIKAAIPDAQVTIRDLAGDGDHYAARVVSRSFEGMSRIRQHQTVYAALGGASRGRASRTAARNRSAENGDDQ